MFVQSKVECLMRFHSEKCGKFYFYSDSACVRDDTAIEIFPSSIF